MYSIVPVPVVPSCNQNYFTIILKLAENSFDLRTSGLHGPSTLPLRHSAFIKIYQLKELYSFLPTTGSPKALAVRASLKTVSSALKDLGEKESQFC